MKLRGIIVLALALASSPAWGQGSQGSSPLSVPKGGSGRATLTQWGVLYGDGVSPVGMTAAGTNGQLFIGQTSAAPAWKTVAGDVTINQNGVTVIGTAKVTLAMLSDATALSALCRSANSAGVPAWCAASNDGEVLRRSGTALGFGQVATSGIADDAVTNAQLRNSGALSLIGRSANSSGDPADISAVAASSCVFRENASTIDCGQLLTAGIANNAVTDGKLRQGVARSVIGVAGNATGNVADIQGTADQVMRVNGAGTALAFGAIDLSKTAAATGVLQPASMPALSGDLSNSAGSTVTAIGANKVLDSMLRQGGALTLMGRSLNTAGNVADIAAAAGSSCAYRENGNTIGCGTLATAAYAANSVTNAKLAQMANGATKCRTTAGTGDPEDCTPPQMRSLLSVVIGTNTQAWDADLDCLAAISTNGMVARTGAGTCAVRTITAPAAGIAISNGDGVSGNPTLALSNDLAAIEALAATGFSTRIAVDTWAQRTIVGTANQIAVTNGDGVSGNPTVSIPSNAALPGAPTTTTAAPNDNSTKIATTAYADTLGALKLNANNGTATGVSDKQGTLKLSGYVTATQITANQNNYIATDGSNTCSTKTELRLSSDAPRVISGLSCGQAEGDIRIAHNVGSQNFTLSNEDSSSLAVNRLLSGADIVMPPNAALTLRYDGVSSRWRPIASIASGGGGGGGGDLVSTNNLSDVSNARSSRQNLGVYKRGADVVSAATTDLTATNSDLVDVTGTTTITAITLNEGDEKTVRFAGSLTLTHGASLILQGNANIITRSGDFAIFRGYASGLVRMVDFKPIAKPLFRAMLSSAQTLNHNSPTKIAFATEVYDNNSNYDNVTNYRFAPTVPGYYKVDLNIVVQGTSGRIYLMQATLFKNGTGNQSTEYGGQASTGQSMPLGLPVIIYLNGTDYIEAFAYQFDYTANASVTVNPSLSNFQATYLGPN